MKITIKGVETSTKFFYWFDTIDNPNNYTVGIERWQDFTAICFYYFCICWGSNVY